MPKIFISYRRKDSRLVTNRIYDRLMAAFGKQDIFKDVDNIPPGMDFRGVLRKATANCKIMLVIIGPRWADIKDEHGQRRLENPNDFVRLEVEAGLQRDDTLVIPVLVENAQMPSAGDLPDALQELAYNNAFIIDSDRHFHRDVDTLIAYIRENLASGVRVPSIDWRWLIGVVIIPIVVAIIGLVSQNIELLNRDAETETVIGETQTTQISQADSEAPTQTNQLETPLQDRTATPTIAPALTLDIPSQTPTISPSEIANSDFEMICPGSVAVDILPDMFGRIVPGDLPNRLRLGPSLSRSTIGQIQPGDYFYVLEGPVCSNDDDFAWIEVNYQGREGWTVVSDATVNLVEPLPDRYPVLNRNSDWSPIQQNFQGVEMVFVPPGCTNMGSLDFDDAQPIEQICFDTPFWIDKFEVANSQFDEFSGNAIESSYNTDSGHPREQISWAEAREFCDSRDSRLPTEAEWEYAARGPSSLSYPWGNSFIQNGGNGVHNSLGGTVDVGTYPAGASWVGAEDMSGNVWEWTHTIYDLYGNNNIYPYPYATDDGREGLRDNVLRSLRGGSFLSSSIQMMSSNRFYRDGNLRDNEIGLRCVRDIEVD